MAVFIQYSVGVSYKDLSSVGVCEVMVDELNSECTHRWRVLKRITMKHDR